MTLFSPGKNLSPFPASFSHLFHIREYIDGSCVADINTNSDPELACSLITIKRNLCKQIRQKRRRIPGLSKNTASYLTRHRQNVLHKVLPKRRQWRKSNVDWSERLLLILLSWPVAVLPLQHHNARGHWSHREAGSPHASVCSIQI